MRFEMPVTGVVPSTQQTQPTSYPSPQQRQMNLYTKTNHNGLILSTSNLMANHLNSNSNHGMMEIKGKGIDFHNHPSKLQSLGIPVSTEAASDGDVNTNHLMNLKAIASTFAPNSPNSSEEDNSPTEMNNCRRLMEKPPLVKRLTMGLLMKTAEDSRPLVYNTHNHSPGQPHLNNHTFGYKNSGQSNPAKGSSNCDGYVNEGACDRERITTNKFGDSSRPSLPTIHQIDNNNQNPELNFKKNLLRETSSGK